MNEITDIFFDLDHTLWDFEKNSALAYKELFSRHKITLDLSTFLDIYVPLNHHYWELYRNEKISKEDLRYKRLGDTFFKLNYSVEEKMINQLSEDYILLLPNNNYLFEGATEILTYLEKKYKLHIITNGFDEAQYLKLKNSNIADFFTTVTTSDEVGVKKPNPEIFAHALRKAKTVKEKSLMIGDNLEADVYGAEKSGLKAIYFNNTTEKDNTYMGLTINHLNKLINLL